MPPKPKKDQAEAFTAQVKVVTKPKSVESTRIVKTPPKVHAKKNKEIPPEERHRMISEAAYFIAERRGFSGRDCEEDWYEAERVVMKFLK